LFGLRVGETVVALDEGGVRFDAFFGVVGGGCPVLFAAVAGAVSLISIMSLNYIMAIKRHHCLLLTFYWNNTHNFSNLWQ
jgi:hypothetical protein